MKQVIVIGGGVIGLCSAYFLRKGGCEVTVIDQAGMDSGASYVNAGYVSPSHIIPLAAPGVIRQGLKWMFNSSSPLYIKPRLEKDFIHWAWAFNRSCSAANVERSIKAIKDIALLSRSLFSEMKEANAFKFHLEKKGLLVLCRTEAMLKKERALLKIATDEGLVCSELTLDALRSLDPKISTDLSGGVIYHCDWHTTPHEFMTELKTFLVDKGVTILKNEQVTDLELSKDKITGLLTEHGAYKADEFVLAAGSWSHLLSKKLGIRIALQAGKGYRINSQSSSGITMPAILAEAKVAVTPMNGFTRYAGTMEIAGINHQIRPERVEAISRAVELYYPSVRVSKEEQQNASCGLRPVSPDGRPYIGRSKFCRNLTIATGHAMMGWSMAPGTGLLVSEIINGKQSSLDLHPFHPDRSF